MAEVRIGLQNVVIATSGICAVDGQEGTLAYRGYDIHELAAHATFEEVVFLLWNGRLPRGGELEELEEQLAANRPTPPEVLDLLGHFPPLPSPMDVLRSAVSSLGLYDPDAQDMSPEANARKAFRLTAQISTVVAAYERIRNGKSVVAPVPKMSHAANFLYMLNGRRPDEESARWFDIALVLHADHGLNPSTLAARVTASTLSDIHSAVTSAIGTLKGHLHGGANEQVMKMLLEIRTPDRVKGYIHELLAQEKKVMGFGHCVYRTQDPRATELRKMSEALCARAGQTKWFEISAKIEEIMMREKNLSANVDFYSATAYYALGIPLDLYPLVFALSRISGWTAHLLEQYAHNKIIWPLARYTGPDSREYVPIGAR